MDKCCTICIELTLKTHMHTPNYPCSIKHWTINQDGVKMISFRTDGDLPLVAI